MVAMMRSSLELLLYPDVPFGGKFTPSPGVRLEAALSSMGEAEHRTRCERKLWQACRKLALAWHGGDEALRAEEDFYLQTVREAPALFGEHALYVHYHLEALVLLARAAMDIAAGAFGPLLTPPFRRDRCDSLNDLVKGFESDGTGLPIGQYFRDLRQAPGSWLNILTSANGHRGLRDKLAHQMEFPIDYMELDPPSEKERAVVWVTRDLPVPLVSFVDGLRGGVVQGFMKLEEECLPQ